MNALEDNSNIKLNLFPEVSLRNWGGGLAWFFWGIAWELYKVLEIFMGLKSSSVDFLGSYKENTFRFSY